MPSYKVVWEIEIESDTPRTAAEEAREIQQDVFSTATVFSVTDEKGAQTWVDLEEAEGEI
jgi:hypothetical protein